jgi:hypothetical protein
MPTLGYAWDPCRVKAGRMSTRIPALAVALGALVVAVPVASAAPEKRAAKKPAKYFFVAQQTETSVITTDCKSVTNDAHRTKTTTTAIRFSETRGYLGGTQSERGYNQYIMERSGNDPYLPPYRMEGEKVEFSYNGDSASRTWSKSGSYATFGYGIVDHDYKVRFRLPRLNKEQTKSYNRVHRNEKSSDARCNNTDRTTITGSVTLQRIQ